MDRTAKAVSEDLAVGYHVTGECVRILLAEMVSGYDSMRSAAKQWRVSPAYVSDVLSGRRLPGAKLLRVMGLAKCQPHPTYFAALTADFEQLRRQYNELIYAVGNRYHNETRHQTALRYIRQAESHDSAPGQAALTPPAADTEGKDGE